MKKGLVDLNLLILIDALINERNLIKASKKLQMSSASLSKALTKLRDWYDDPLFVRKNKSFEPTQLSIDIHKELPDFIWKAKEISGMKADSRKTSNLSFEIERPLSEFLFSYLCQVFSDDDCNLTLKDWGYSSLENIINGRSDVGLCGLEKLANSKYNPESLPYYVDYRVLHEDTPCIYINKNSNFTFKNIKDFKKSNFIGVLWEDQQDWSFDIVLKRHGIKRKVSILVESFEQALTLIDSTEINKVVVAPSYCTGIVKSRYKNIKVMPLPLNETDLDDCKVLLTLMWHKRNNGNSKIKEIKRELGDRLLSELVK